MRYFEAAAAAPAGRERFGVQDLARLCRSTLAMALQPGPAAPPLPELAAALGDRPRAFAAVAAAISPSRRARLLRLRRPHLQAADREAARRRLVGALFWYLAYELEPERWARLAAAERISPELLAKLPCDGLFVVEVGAGSGRLSVELAARAGMLIAVEPCPSLRALLRARLPARCAVVAAVGHRLPIATGAADLVVSCATFGPDFPLGGEAVLAELERCARPGGAVALVGPENPAWFERHGYRRTSFRAPRVALDPELRAEFGPPSPPHDLLLLTR